MHTLVGADRTLSITGVVPKAHRIGQRLARNFLASVKFHGVAQFYPNAPRDPSRLPFLSKKLREISDRQRVARTGNPKGDRSKTPLMPAETTQLPNTRPTSSFDFTSEDP